MCGEFEEDDLLDGQLYERYLALARTHGVSPDPGNKQGDKNLAQKDDLAAYMEELFQAGLLRSANDTKFIGSEGDRMNAVAIQAVVFARLAGFLAGQVPVEANMTKACMEAMLEGMNEAQDKAKEWDKAMASDHHHGHHHHHGHDHSHGAFHAGGGHA